MGRIDVLKTYKLYIDGKFPRTESGRTMELKTAGGDVHLCKASRKDLRDAVEAGRKVQPGWAAATAYLRGQILYRIAEMMEGKRRELAEAIEAVGAGGVGGMGGRKPVLSASRRAGSKSKLTPETEVTLAIDRVVHYAGWADKYAQVLGCNNPVAGPFYNFTAPEPTGVVAVVCPDEAPLLGMVSLLAPVICPGNAAVVVASEKNPIPAAVFAEACATGDLPGGVVNILTAERAELVGHLASHRDLDAVVGANLSAEHAVTLRKGAAENLKRVTLHDVPDWADTKACEHPWWIENVVEMKTMWHPAGA